MKKLALRLAFSFWLVALPAATEPLVVRMPFTVQSSLMLLEMQTSVGKLWLALDTGASKSVLQSKLMPSGDETQSMNGRQVPLSRDPLVITLGPFRFKVHPLLLSDKRGFLRAEKTDEHVLSGALGQDFFGFWDKVTVDNLRHEVIFEKGLPQHNAFGAEAPSKPKASAR